MATWTVTGIATDGSSLQFVPGTGLQLNSALFGDEVKLTLYQSSTHADAGGNHVCQSTHLNNTQYTDSTHLKINGSGPYLISPTTPRPTTAEVPLKLTFAHTANVTVSNPSLVAYDLDAPDAGVISGISIRAFEQGNATHTSWRDINGVPMTFSTKTGAASYSWYFALSASPTTGVSKSFGLRFSLFWV